MRYIYRCVAHVLSFAITLLFVSCNNSFDSPSTSLLSVDMEGHEQTILLSDLKQGYWGPALSPDGNQLAFSVTPHGDKNSQLFLSNTDGSGLIQLTDNGRNNYLPAWSPNGEVISFISQTGDTSTAEIYTIRVDDTNEVQLTDNDAWEYGTSWSPDGRKILFGSDRSGEWQIHSMSPDGSDQGVLPVPAQGNAPAWSPDGLQIAFTSDRDGDDDIWVMNADGSNQENLTNNDAWDDQPQWSPDGMKIAFTSDRDGMANIFMMNLDGSGSKNLTPHLSSGIPVWTLDGSRLIFHAVTKKK